MPKDHGRLLRRGRFIRRAYDKILAYRPPRSIIAALIIATSIFLLGGGIYISIIPSMFLLIESIGVMILYALGSLGLILIYYSARRIRDQRYALIIMEIGISLLLISFIMVEFRFYSY